jgi:hypothetical protein
MRKDGFIMKYIEKVPVVYTYSHFVSSYPDAAGELSNCRLASSGVNAECIERAVKKSKTRL